MKLRAIVSGVSIAALFIALALLTNTLITFGTQPSVKEKEQENNLTPSWKTTLNVVGYGSVKYLPDMVSLDFTMIGQGTSAEEALTRCSEKTTSVINILKSLGVSEEDLRTEYINVYPLYDWEAKPPKIIGYEAQYSLNVIIRDMLSAGKMIDSVVRAGVDRLDGVTFVLSPEKESELKMEAIRLAVEDAGSKASMIAKTLGLKILSIESVTLSSIWIPTPIPIFKEQISPASVPILPGQGEITATVNIVYTLEAAT